MPAPTGTYEAAVKHGTVKSGIIDPTMVTRSALQNAASIAKNILTTEVVIAEAPETERMGAAMPSGLGDMM